jgi:hypothetical protein
VDRFVSKLVVNRGQIDSRHKQIAGMVWFIQFLRCEWNHLVFMMKS